MTQTPPTPPRRLALLGTAGHVPDPARFDDEALLGVLGANSGNLMFQYAATRLIGAPLNHISPAFTAYGDPAGLAGVQALIFPAANHLRAGADWTGLNAYLEGCGKPLIVLGLGAQGALGASPRETVASLNADRHVRRLVDILRERAALVTLRGPFTALICEAMGLDGGEVLGCPSVLLNPASDLGMRIESQITAQITAFRGRRADVPLRSAIAAAAPYEIAAHPQRLALERRLFAWFPEALYIQQSGGVEAMRAASGRWGEVTGPGRKAIARTLAPDLAEEVVGARLDRHGRFFSSAPDWIAAMADCDLAIGTRLHGVMAALAAGRPGVIIPHDSRTAELAEIMHLPQIDLARALAAPDPAALLQAIRFDGARFDRWRNRAAARLAELFARAGLPAATALTALAKPEPQKRTA